MKASTAYSSGKGVVEDRQAAAELLRAACRAKHKPACATLKRMGEDM
jgi:TPR repeat protein